MLLRAEERNVFEGFRVGRNRTRVSHLQFADDTIFFSSTREEDLLTLKSVLLVFGHISGLKVNLDKSNIYGINLGQDHLHRLAEVLDCKASGWPILYLGLPLGGNPKSGKWLWRYPREGSALWHQVILSIYGSHSNGYCTSFPRFSKFTRFMVGDGERIRFWEDLWWGDQPLGVRFPRLLRVVMDKNIPISSILGSTRPFSWNFNFRRNLSDSEIEDLESLMRSLDHIHLSPSVPDKRSWSLSSSGLFTVKSFFLALSQISGLPSVFPTKLVWNSQVPFKIKSFVWLVAHKKIISLTKIDWVPPRSIFDMLSTNCNGFGSSKRWIVLWQVACIALLWVVFLRDFLNVIHLDWLVACNSIGLA
ncbi:hypothetical protein AAG906_011533 [Vitis piasezkii]